MIVTMQDRGSGVFSLRVGVRNARRSFQRSAPAVDLDLESVQIRCELRQECWQGHPEIRDPRLCAWLTAKKAKWKVDGDTLVLLMLPAGPMCFACSRGSQRETWIARGPGSIASRDGS
jgi:hypothetical protein